uniref:LRRNT domain-containing protein n=1 Tax=Capitella teleta TaxID=283909 RepID=X2B967_CAPTE
MTEIPNDIPLDVTTISISGNSITTLGPNAFSNFTELTELDLYSNNISFIHDDAFEGVHKLQQLNLGSNQLADFPVLRNMPKLTYLYLNNNNIRKIQVDALDLL